MKIENKILNQSNLLALSLIILLITRAGHFINNSYALLSYDYSFYLFAAENILKSSQTKLLTGLSGGYNSWLFYISSFFNLPSEFILNITFFIASILTGVCFYFVFNKKNATAGILAVFLIAVSPIQTEVYNIFLWKNLITIPILLLAYKFLEEKNWKLVTLFSFLILITHRTTAIIYFLSLFIYFLYQNLSAKKFKNAAIILSGTLFGSVILYFIPSINKLVTSLLSNPNVYVRTGLFLEQENLFFLGWPVLILGLLGLWKQAKNKLNTLWLVFTGLCLVWFILHLPFYRRVLIFLDLGLIYFAADFLSQINYKNWQTKTFLAILFVYLLIFNFQFSTKRQQLISKAQIIEIKNFVPKNPGDFVLTTSANNAPWLLGYSKNIRLAAPGLFEDRNSYQEWQDFWQGKNQEHFLSKYPRPLYLYQRDYITPGEINNCLKPISENFSEYICK